MLPLYRGDGLVVEEVGHILLTEVVGRRLLAVVVHFLYLTQDLIPCPVVFGGGEAMVFHPFHLAQSSCQSLEVLALLGHHLQLQGILRARHEIGGKGCAGVTERALGLYGLFREAGVEHLADGTLGVVDHIVRHVALHLVGHGVKLHESEEDAQLLLLVLTHEINTLVVVGHLHGLYLGGVGRHLDAAKEFLDLLLGAVHIDVANDDDTLIVGTIPLAVVGPEGLG